MAAPEDTTASPAGPAADLDIGALYTRLQGEIRRSGNAGPDGGDVHAARGAVRGLAERYWAVTAERPLERRSGLKGAFAYPVKQLLRPLLRWYVEPFAYEQRMFNDAALKLIDSLQYGLSERIDREVAAAEAARRLYVHYNTVRGRLARIEELIGPFLADTERLTALAVALHIHRRGH